MLEKYDIEVDLAESAEQAIEYLNGNRPDAIFMDHLMPGMDGLQAVQAIKGNPQTAMIPIMMYTSQEGELYVGQARALGAMGVLPKQVRPVDVSKVLYELHLLPDRRDMDEPALQPVELDGGRPVERSAAPPSGADKLPGPDWGRRVEAAIKEQAVDIRRFMVASLDSFAARIVADVREKSPAPAGDLLPSPVAARKPAVWPWAAALLAACVIAGVFAVFWALAREDLTKAHADQAALTAANVELQHARQDLASTVRDLTAALAASAAAQLPPALAGGSVLSRSEPVPYGEIPFDRTRLDVLRDFLAKLEAQGFHGVVKISSAAGMFCLTGNANDGFAPASPSMLVAKCDLVGNPFEESLTAQQRQSLAFANLVAGVRQRTSSAISVVLDNAGSGHTAVAYPPRTESLTAGEWNRAAAANNRVEFSADPAP
jgi:CheY-like chemotaxis protein